MVESELQRNSSEQQDQENKQLDFSDDDVDFLMGNEIQHVELQDLRGTGFLQNRMYLAEDCNGIICSFLVIGVTLLIILLIAVVSVSFAIAHMD